MIKEKLMDALKVAAAEYNGGMSANAAVVKAASAADFNEHQTERLVEMFNTLAALNKEKDANDPAGSCELASKDDVIRDLLAGDGIGKDASVHSLEGDYAFYSFEPRKTNSSIESRESGVYSMMKAASAEDAVPDELDVSQRSLYKTIVGKIELLKSAADAADEASRMISMELDNCAVKVAKVIEDPFAPSGIADMFKAVCPSEKAVKAVGEYSTKVAESNGGDYALREVFDSSMVENLLKIAEDIEKYASQIPEYERLRDFYMSKAAEAENRMKAILGMEPVEKKESIADFFAPESVVKKAGSGDAQSDGGSGDEANLTVKIAELIRRSGVSSESVEMLAKDLEKDAAPGKPLWSLPAPSLKSMSDALSGNGGVDGEKEIVLNVRRAMILSDLMNNDPIIRDADPDTVVDTYKTIVMTSPRVALDKSQVRAVLRNAINSVAFSPNDAKVLSDVDKGVALANVERLTNLDSSIKDSNIV